MRNKIGIICMLLGAAFILGALSLFIYNQKEALEAEQTSNEVLPQIIEEIQKEKKDENRKTVDGMSVMEIDGYDYVGYIAIPNLELELPVMSDWDYDKLKRSPCRYKGSVLEGNLVIMAHNYARHFGRIDELSEGDRITFSDMDGIITSYRVEGIDILVPSAVEEMIAGDFDLTLFTCTYGGQSRVTLYCNRVQNDQKKVP